MQRHIKLIIVSAVILLTLALIAIDRTNLTDEDTPAATTPDASGQKAPDVTFIRLDGGDISLRSLSGHTVWLHFWASWCVPCREEFPALLKRLQASDNTILLAVSGDMKAEDARAFIAPLKKDFGPLFASGRVIIADDPEHKLIEGVFQTFQYPETIVITPGLIMNKKIAGVW